ncbi:MAG: DUF4293 domain-containing protein [Bacteroidia bacterium]|nr:DUF4293 domain-containing protein [Bacteroidia bacterium]
MIQRVQSIYLLTVFVLTALLFFFPVLEYTTKDGAIFSFGASGIKALQDGKWVFVQSAIQVSFLIPLMAVIAIVSIFLYKKRRWQMTLCLVNIILPVILIITGTLFISRIDGIAFHQIHFRHIIAIPFINMLLNSLAYRRIQGDEKLVKSYDRIR